MTAAVTYNLANKLTLIRLALLPFIILLFFIPAAWAAWTCLVLYVLGALTDLLDGWVARKYAQTSAFGAAMDPIADKIFVVTVLLMLVATQRMADILTLAVIVILMREFLVAGLREFLGPKGVSLPVTKLAKWKTATQMVATGILIVGHYVSGGVTLLGEVLLAVSAGLTVVTGWGYIKASLPHISD